MLAKSNFSARRFAENDVLAYCDWSEQFLCFYDNTTQHTSLGNII